MPGIPSLQLAMSLDVYGSRLVVAQAYSTVPWGSYCIPSGVERSAIGLSHSEISGSQDSALYAHISWSRWRHDLRVYTTDPLHA
jgi:hypothetical protein